VKGLPQHGFPYAVAIAQARPDAARPQVKVRALRIDPRAVRLEPGPVTDTDPHTSATIATFKAPPARPGQTTLWLVDDAFALTPTPPQAAPQTSAPASGAAAASPVALASGWLLSQLPRNEQPRAAVGIHDEDGMLEWIELAPQTAADAGTTALLDATLARSGCSVRIVLPAAARVLLGDDLDLTMTTLSPSPPPAADAAAAVPTVTVALQRRQTPGARDYFPTTPIVSPSVWQPLQSKRVRYFPKKKKIETDAGAGSNDPGDNPEKNP
jgi:hypothetical protein